MIKFERERGREKKRERRVLILSGYIKGRYTYEFLT